MRVIMGVDPSTKTGVVIIKGDEVLYQGTIRSNTDNYLTNGFVIAQELVKLINEYKVDYICLENYAMNARFRIVDMWGWDLFWPIWKRCITKHVNRNQKLTCTSRIQLFYLLIYPKRNMEY